MENSPGNIFFPACKKTIFRTSRVCHPLGIRLPLKSSQAYKKSQINILVNIPIIESCTQETSRACLKVHLYTRAPYAPFPGNATHKQKPITDLSSSLLSYLFNLRLSWSLQECSSGAALLIAPRLSPFDKEHLHANLVCRVVVCQSFWEVPSHPPQGTVGGNPIVCVQSPNS